MKKYIIGFYRKCDLLTMCSVLLSIVSIILCLNNNIFLASFILLLCGLCDALDGKLARSKKYSINEQKYGLQLDSLADVISFGLTPALITIISFSSTINIIISIFYVLCGIIRLAYFNMLNETNESKKGYFIGVPITTVSVVYPISLFIIKIINIKLAKYIMPFLLLILGILYISNIKVKKFNIDKLLKIINNKYLINFAILPLFAIISLDIFHKININNIDSIFLNEIFMLFNHFIPFILILIFFISLHLFIISLSNETIHSKRLILIITIFMCIVGGLKYNIMGKPIEFTDISYLNPSAVENMIASTNVIGNWFNNLIIKSIILIIISIIFIKLDKYQKITFVNKKNRIICLILSSLLLISSFIVFTNNKMLLKLYNISYDEICKINDINYFYDNYGYYQAMILLISNNKIEKPNNYNSYDIDKLINNIEIKSSKWPKSNVIIILSESFTNPNYLDNISFNQEVIPNINKYKKDNNNSVFELISPVYGGMSPNTEFEILTGASINFWKTEFIPYSNYYNKDNYKNSPNIIKEFKNNNYETTYITASGPYSYRSEENYKNLGMDNLSYYNYYNCDIKGYYCSDDYIIDSIIKQLNSNKDKKQFIYAATMENHFPYNNKFNNYDINITKSNLHKDASNTLLNYLEGLYDADKSLNRLYEEIKRLDEPTIILFYGDHYPYLNDTYGNKILDNFTYYSSKDEYINYLRYHKTLGVLLANYDIEIDDINMINMSYLGSYIINKMDLEVSNYFKFIDYTRTIIPSFTRNFVYSNNEYKDFNNLNKEEEIALNNYKSVQYRMFYDK